MKKIEEPVPVSPQLNNFHLLLKECQLAFLLTGGCGGKQVCLPARGGRSGQRRRARGLD